MVFMYEGPGSVAESGDMRCHYVGSTGPGDWNGWRRARALFKQLNPEIVHYHQPIYWLHGALAGCGYKKVQHLHGPFFISRMGRIERALSIIVPRVIDHHVCITEEIRQFALRRNWASAERSSNVYNAVNCVALDKRPSRAAARLRLGLPADARIIGMVCRLAWYKGCDDGIRVLSRLGQNWHLVFCGDGPITEELRQLAREHGVADRIHFTGMLEDIRVAYASMDAFLFLSRTEPFGLVIAEAMASGIPVFGLSSDGGYNDPNFPLVTADNAVFLPRRDATDFERAEDPLMLDALAARIREMEIARKVYGDMAERARTWVRNRFDAPRQAAEMTVTYQRLVRRSTARRGTEPSVVAAEGACKP
jgi:glycosyltransferase involved in cell wall biosynthesis